MALEICGVYTTGTQHGLNSVMLSQVWALIVTNYWMKSYQDSVSEDGDNLMLTKESVDISPDDEYKGILDVSLCEFTMIDSQGHSCRDHKQYQQYVRKGTLLALNYWYPLGFYGYSDLYFVVVLF